MLFGEAGVGKTALLDMAVERAAELGYQVLRAGGSEAELHLPFAGLHQLIYSQMHLADDLPPVQRNAILTAFGRTESIGIDPYLISLAALELLGAIAAKDPLLVAVDDVHWIDTPTMDVIDFVSRRIGTEPVMVLLSSRPSVGGGLINRSMEVIELQPLNPSSAQVLIDRVAPDLTTEVRQRLLSAANGNPLALLELPTVAPHQDFVVADPVILPLTSRLEGAFADRAATLPSTTRTLLTVACVDDGRDVGEMVAAAALLLPDSSVTFADLEPAIAHRLVHSDGKTLEFRHPLVRSAIHGGATLSAKHAAHVALAHVLDGDPDRAVWHNAAVASAPEEGIATQLEAAAQRSRSRGAVASSVSWFERAASLSPLPADRYGRLLSAAEVAFELGRFRLAESLRARVVYQDMRAEDQARLLWLDGVFHDGRPAGTEGIRNLAAKGDQAARAGDEALAMHLYVAAARLTWWADPGPELRYALVSAAEALSLPSGDVQLALVRSTAAALECAPRLLNALSHWDPHGDLSPVVKGELGTVAFCTGDFIQAIEFLSAPVESLRARGQLSLLAQTLSLRAWAGFYVGYFDIARGSDEAALLAAETGQPRWVAIARVCEAAATGLRTGTMATHELRSAEDLALDGATPMSSLLAGIQVARGVTFLSAGDFRAAYAALSRLFDPQDPAHHRMLSLWHVNYFAESAALTGHLSEGRQVLSGLRGVDERAPSEGVRVAMDYARAVLAENSEAEALFTAALDNASNMPWHRARLQLAYGSWLRRQRRSRESREFLRAARDAFDILGMSAWAQRAHRELAASGERQQQPVTSSWASLTAQEAQIAELAAQGKSNREIGQELYMSHRTVGAHLYHIFPKLGISSRSQLGRLLTAGQEAAPDLETRMRVD